MMTLYLDAVSVAAPGLNNWQQAAAMLRGEEAYTAAPLEIKAPQMLPAAERRRSSDSVRLTLRVASEALSGETLQNVRPVAVFSSAYGDPMITHKLCDMLSANPPLSSPILFHNSVQNAPAGYWSIAAGHNAATTSISAGTESFASALLYAAAQGVTEQRPVLLVCHDLTMPPPLDEKCHVSAPFACALLLSTSLSGSSLARLELEPAQDTPGKLEQPALESLRLSNPAARSLPLLQAIARGSGDCTLPYLEQQSLFVRVSAP